MTDKTGAPNTSRSPLPSETCADGIRVDELPATTSRSSPVAVATPASTGGPAARPALAVNADSANLLVRELCLVDPGDVDDRDPYHAEIYWPGTFQE